MGKAAREITFLGGLCGAVIAMTLALCTPTLPAPAAWIITLSAGLFALGLVALPFFAWLQVRPLRQRRARGFALLDRALATTGPDTAQLRVDFEAWRTDVDGLLRDWLGSEERTSFRAAGAHPPWTDFGTRTSDQTRLVHAIEQHLTALQKIIEGHR